MIYVYDTEKKWYTPIAAIHACTLSHPSPLEQGYSFSSLNGFKSIQVFAVLIKTEYKPTTFEKNYNDKCEDNEAWKPVETSLNF